MDMITELFIKQCERAEEIQKLCEYKMGDWFYTTIYRRGVHKGFMVISIDYGDNYPNGILPDKHKKDNFVTKGGGWWLPTLEQLFDIWSYLCNTNNKAHPEHLAGDHLPTHFIEEIYSYLKNKRNWFDKEMCLEIIMRDFYNKQWAGKDWITIEGGE